MLPGQITVYEHSEHSQPNTLAKSRGESLERTAVLLGIEILEIGGKYLKFKGLVESIDVFH